MQRGRGLRERGIRIRGISIDPLVSKKKREGLAHAGENPFLESPRRGRALRSVKKEETLWAWSLHRTLAGGHHYGNRQKPCRPKTNEKGGLGA